MPNYPYSYAPTPWAQPSVPNYSGTNYYSGNYTQPTAINPPYSSQQTMPQPNYAYANSVNNKNIIWVADQAGAEAYQMEPGSRAVLLDSKDQVFYIKVVGPDGRPEPLMAFKYEPLNLNMQNESSQAAPAIDTSNFATKDDLNEIMNYIKQMSNRGNQQSQTQKGMNKNV